MKRNIAELTSECYDILIIGGGIYGACIAWEATLQGLTVALVEPADFSSSTANSLKTIYSGWRFQPADWKRRAICAQRTLMQIAPHLVHPLPVLIPTYGQGIWGKAVMSAALVLNELVSGDRHQLADPQKRMPPGQLLSRHDCLQLLPGINQLGITGGAVFYDTQVHNSERLVLAFLRSAAQAGAAVANYVEVTELLRSGNCIIGVAARDRLTGKQHEIRARTVVNTTGSWINQLLDNLPQRSPPQPQQLVKAINLVTRQLFQTYAVGLTEHSNQGSNLLLVAPWRERSLVGTKYIVCKSQPDALQVTELEILEFLAQINRAYPAAQLTLADVAFAHHGLLPSSEISLQTDQIYDYRDRGIKGLISVVGVRYTTARTVAAKVVQRVLPATGKTAINLDRWRLPPLYGGRIENFAAFLQAEIDSRPVCINETQMCRLIYNYGSAYPSVLQYWWDSSATDKFGVLRAEVLHGVREEMAQQLADIVFRRTEIGTAGNPGIEVLQICAETMSAELGWSSARMQQELQSVNQVFAERDWSQTAIKQQVAN